MKRREKDHRKSNSGCVAFSNAIKKYGFENFKHEILAENLTLDDANALEETYINSHNTLHPNGYNLKYGGDNRKYSDISKERMRISHIGQIRNHSEETRVKLSAAKIGNKNPMFGKPMSNEHKNKIINSMAGKNSGKDHPQYGLVGELSHNSKKYIITYPNGGELCIVGLTKFCRENNLSQGHMAAVARGERKQHKGYTCRFNENN